MTNGILNRDKTIEQNEYINEIKQECFKEITSENINRAIVNELRTLYFDGAIPKRGKTTLEIVVPIVANISTSVQIFNDKDFLMELEEYLKDTRGELLLSGDDNVVEFSSTISMVNGYYCLIVVYVLRDCGEEFLF